MEANDQQGIALLRWHGQHASESRVRQQVLREPVNRYVAQTGEVPDGTGVRAAVDQFYIK